MTQPPFDTGPGQPPGFAPPPAPGPGSGQAPWTTGVPLAAARDSAKKRFVVVMAFFALLLVVSVAGFVMTAGDDVKNAATGLRDRLPDVGLPDVGATARPSFGEPSDPPVRGPVPKPVTYRGTGKKTIKIRRPEPGDALIYVRANPGSNGFLTVFGIDAQGQRNGLAITSFGRYEGVRMLEITRLTRTTSVEIDTQGAWVVQIRSARGAKAGGAAMSGTGDAVLRYTGPAGTATIKGGSEMRPFLVMTHLNGYPRLVASGVGSFNGDKAWPQGPVLVEVQATGPWSIRVR